ncbi:DUF3325 domain-containing protein [Xylophilus sp. ASV27]|uniref:DUF3325 domain-containing protein n=1 Tax=Xylophilus sp. ASV27 TaxID=2795129 RepID=UPI0018ED5F0F|nr:DUF3325 domain-containing protein [Xylophilus sp. ASV27]
MREALLTLLAAALAYAGFALWALSQQRHVGAVLGTHDDVPVRTAALRISGSILLLAALALCLRGHGPGLGSVVWMVLISVAAIAVAFTLAWRARWLRHLAGRYRRV